MNRVVRKLYHPRRVAVYLSSGRGNGGGGYVSDRSSTSGKPRVFASDGGGGGGDGAVDGASESTMGGVAFVTTTCGSCHADGVVSNTIDCTDTDERSESEKSQPCGRRRGSTPTGLLRRDRAE